MGQSPSMGLLALDGSAAATSALGTPCRRFHSSCSAELAITSCSVRVLLLPLNTCIAVRSEVCLDIICSQQACRFKVALQHDPPRWGLPASAFSPAAALNWQSFLLCASASAAIEQLQPAMLKSPFNTLGDYSSCSRPTKGLPQAENTVDAVASEKSQGKE